jgi:hypothetical protein
MLLPRLNRLQAERPWCSLRDADFRQDGGALRGRVAAPSYQAQDAPSETLGGALRINIREIEQQGRGSITIPGPIR